MGSAGDRGRKSPVSPARSRFLARSRETRSFRPGQDQVSEVPVVLQVIDRCDGERPAVSIARWGDLARKSRTGLARYGAGPVVVENRADAPGVDDRCAGGVAQVDVKHLIRLDAG